VTTFVADFTLVVALAAAFIVGFAVVRERSARLRADDAVREATHLRAQLGEARRRLADRVGAEEGHRSTGSAGAYQRRGQRPGARSHRDP
jgi:hypothetical protein